MRARTLRQCHRNVPDRVRPRGGNGGGKRHIQHTGRIGVCRPGREESHHVGKVAAAPGQRSVLSVHRRPGHHRSGRRGHVVRGAVSAVHVLWVLPTDVHAGKTQDCRQKVEKQKLVPVL